MAHSRGHMGSLGREGSHTWSTCLYEGRWVVFGGSLVQSLLVNSNQKEQSFILGSHKGKIHKGSQETMLLTRTAGKVISGTWICL